ncbi:MAG: UvrD-helicase domain-containing protein [Cryomorphaceae bacterium]|nr:UvrD-helicase domain-containing protein [Cryomorphaceae bacterium]
MLPNASLTIFNASAGTGKTYTLTREFISLCLADDNPYAYRNILALTFTNKAAAEMRERILSKLRALAEGCEEDMAPGLLTTLKIDENTLQERASKVITAIIHDLASLSISTIDRFTYRLLRTFSFELNINNSARLRMDADTIAKQTVDALLEDAGENDDTMLQNYLSSFVRNQIRNDKSWNIVTQLEDIVKKLHHENDREAVNALREHDLNDFNNTRKSIAEKRKKLESEIKAAGKTAEALLDQIEHLHGDISHFNDLPSFFKKINDRRFELPGSRLRKNRESIFLKKSAADRAGEMEEFAHAFDQAVTVMETHLPDYNLLREIEKHFDAVALLGTLHHAYKRIQKEENFINIGEFQSMINQLTDSDTPDYIFERLGDRYTWFFIDEFQDTSNLQWNNLKTLAQHAMANNGGSMLVGDPKQSIYRWRGSNPELFLNIINDKDPDRFSHLSGGQTVDRYGLNKKTLDINFRSGQAIVQFVHDLFIHKGEANTHAESAYSEVTKKANKDFIGWVNLEFYPNTEAFEDVEETRLISMITDALSDGYALSDITILVRNTKDSKRVAEWISAAKQSGYPQLNVISNESFILDNQPHIKLIIALLSYLLYPFQKGSRFDILHALAELNILQSDDIHPVLEAKINLDQDNFEAELRLMFPLLNMEMLRPLPLVDKCMRIMQMTGLKLAEDVYLQAFIEAVRARVQESPLDEHEFLRWWNDSRRDSIGIEIPENLNAITVTTIHKAKGLEWPVVIIPFANWQYQPRTPQMWLKNNHIDLNYAQVDIKKIDDKKPMPSNYVSAVESYEEEQRFDNLNLLYVAFTRAAQRLLVMSKKPRNNSNTIHEFLCEKLNIAKLEDMVAVTRGEQSARIDDKGKPNTFTERYIQHSNADGIAPVLQVGRKYSPGINDLPAIARGNTIHDALQLIALDRKKIIPVVEEMIRSQRIKANEREDIEQAIEAIVKHPLCVYIRENASEVHTEQTILLPGGEILRPDLIATTTDGQTFVIDYKTGDPMPKHQQQLQRYIDVLQQMGRKNVQGELIYV